jgi:hypothetical protein
MSLLRESKQYATPQATLRRRAANNKFVTGISKGLRCFNETSDAAVETELMDRPVCLECRCLG